MAVMLEHNKAKLNYVGITFYRCGKNTAKINFINKITVIVDIYVIL